MRNFFTFLEQYRFVREGSWLLLILSPHHIKHLLVWNDVELDQTNCFNYKALPEVFLAPHISLLLQTGNAQMVMQCANHLKHSELSIKFPLSSFSLSVHHIKLSYEASDHCYGAFGYWRLIDLATVKSCMEILHTLLKIKVSMISTFSIHGNFPLHKSSL